jgi:hypothetical protein
LESKLPAVLSSKKLAGLEQPASPAANAAPHQNTMLEMVRQRGKTNSPGWFSRLVLKTDFASSRWRRQDGHAHAVNSAVGAQSAG